MFYNHVLEEKRTWDLMMQSNNDQTLFKTFDTTSDGVNLLDCH